MSAELFGAAVLGSFWWITAAAVLAVCLRLGEGLVPGLRYLLALAAMCTAPVVFVGALPVTAGGGGPVTYAVEEWAQPAGLGWLCGVGLLSARTFGGWLYLRLLLRRAAVIPWPAMEALRRRMGVWVAVEMRASGRADSPFTAGWRRPVIVMPLATLAGLPADQLEAIVLHELAHIRRMDYALEWVLQAMETVFFYHPAMWWMTAMARQERERSCDDMAIAAGADRAAYARALVELEALRTPAAAVGWAGGGLRGRVARILGSRQRTAVWPVAVMAVLTLAGQAQTAYQAWVNEDVVYIIQPEEKRAYLSLRDDAERQQFIAQFWERRDPTPGTPANEAKEEHYRRIQWANERCQEPGSSKPGWTTEKGRTYIRFGPPDEIERHPAKGYEQWLYREIPGVGTKVIFEFGNR
jgi:GWxTD domain-containing protein